MLLALKFHELQAWWSWICWDAFDMWYLWQSFMCSIQYIMDFSSEFCSVLHPVLIYNYAALLKWHDTIVVYLFDITVLLTVTINYNLRSFRCLFSMSFVISVQMDHSFFQFCRDLISRTLKLPIQSTFTWSMVPLSSLV